MRRKQTPIAPVVEPSPLQIADALMEEMAELYRARLRAMYNNDPAALYKINEDIARLKAKIDSL
jgi:hypothetical protein